MAYTNRPAESVVERTYATVAEYHDRVRWGPVLAGIVIALSTQLVLSAFGAAVGLTNIAGSGAPRTEAPDVGTAVGVWNIISLFISLLIGGWVMARACGPMNRGTALLNGAILWGTTLAFSAWLLASGVTGAFGLLAANAAALVDPTQPGGGQLPPGATTLTAEQARQLADYGARVSWSFAFGSLLGLAAALIGAAIGARNPRVEQRIENRPI